MFRLKAYHLKSVVELVADTKCDSRGSFVKTVHAGAFIELGLPFEFKEQYYTVSHRGVLRGLHFQVPPHDHGKLVYCTDGAVFDVIVDLRNGSSTYGHHAVIELSATEANILYIPAGFAHGFYVVSLKATMVYNVTSVYSVESDTGIRWDSISVDWPNRNPVISLRDANFQPFAQFSSPFIYDNG